MTPTDEFPKLLELAAEEVAALTHQVITEHKLGELTGWSLDEATGRLLFTDSNNRYAMMNAQMLGIYDTTTRTWQWAWSDTSFPEHLTQAARHGRGWGEANNVSALTEAVGTVDEVVVQRLSAFVTRLVDWPGLYRGLMDTKAVYIAFSPMAPPQG